MDQRIIQAEFVCSYASLNQLENTALPEVAFLGRSNVGKSSLINALCGQKSLAKTSKMPGRTQLFNFFKVKFSNQNFAHFVDLPGFGYANVPKALKNKWAKMIDCYLQEREQLQLVVLLIDSRRKPGEEEQAIIDLGAEGGLLVVLTKVDKLKRTELEKKKKEISNYTDAPIVAVSVEKGKRQGLENVCEHISHYTSA